MAKVNPPPKQKNILIHCASGISRSVSTVIAYLIQKEEYTYQTALDLITKTRVRANPNAGFRMQLEIMEEVDGDLIEAVRVYKERAVSDGKNLIESMIGQRGGSNRLHFEIDGIEEQYKNLDITLTDNSKIIK